MKKIFLMVFMALALIPKLSKAEQKVVLVTVDGYRWQELFGGADSLLINSKQFGDVTMMKLSYWKGETPQQRRMELMPFTWTFIAKNGTIIGDRNKGCTMDVTNKMWFSYPGYNEDLCGHADDANIHSNDAIPNPNMTVFEIANNIRAVCCVLAVGLVSLKYSTRREVVWRSMRTIGILCPRH